MFSVCVRDHFMIAHSFRGEVFGPAQSLHGATYVVDVEFKRAALDADGLVVDIGRATAAAARRARGAELPQPRRRAARSRAATRRPSSSRSRSSSGIAAEIEGGTLGPARPELAALRVTLHESHVAWAAYEARSAA